MTELELAKLESNVNKLIITEFCDKKDAGGHDYLQHLYAVADAIDKEANYEVEIISTDKAGNTETTNKGTEEVANNIKFTVDKIPTL